MEPHLRIESVNGEVLLTTHDGRTLTPDVLTIRLQAGRVARIKVETEGKEPEYLSCNKFFGNGGR